MVYNMCVLSKKVGGREEKRLENARQLRHDSGMKKRWAWNRGRGAEVTHL